jgi:hypothetical protein
MKRHMTVAMVVLSIVGTIPTISDAFAGRRNTIVNPVSEVVFEVIVPRFEVSTDFWCGAADYSRRALGASWKTRIYVARTRGKSVTSNYPSAVHYTIDPKAAGVTPIETQMSLGSFKVGDSMSVQQANNYCQKPKILY